MKKTKIEHQALKCIGVSEKGLRAYADTWPLDVYKTDDGYKIAGCIETTCSTDADLIAFFEELAAEAEADD